MSNKVQTGLKLALDQLGFNFCDPSSTNQSRAVYLAYFARNRGIHVGNWPFVWHYTRGVDSPELRRDVTYVMAKLRSGIDDSIGWNIDNTSQRRLEELKKLCQQRTTKDLGLLTFALFLIETEQTRGRNQREKAEGIFRCLSRYEMYFTKGQVSNAMRELQSLGFLG